MERKIIRIIAAFLLVTVSLLTACKKTPEKKDGHQKKVKKSRAVRFYAVAAAASVAIVAAIGITLSNQDHNSCIRYSYGKKEDDETLIMESVESSLADFFAGKTPAEANLFELFER